ncbi:MAG: sigma-70 family RNA polymerase sigma factor [Rubrivivax sp.]|nr:sigma-70 family RNA polymerase sigma factor [Rubrivivax sp.]
MTAAAQAARTELQAVLATQRRRVVARLARSLGLSHLAQAEDAVQAAALRALQHWPLHGVPANPAGWLYRVAQRAAIDALRVAGRHDSWPDDDDSAAAAALPSRPPPSGRFAGELDDDELALLFAACHPTLPPASQVALALRVLAGLDHATIAAGLLCSEAALTQRLARARELLSPQALRLPAGHELPPRREAVLTALALAFHAGARARARRAGEAAALCWEAIRLARALAAHPAAAHPDADALAATLLLHGARLSGQLDDEGDIVLLPGQPRDRWDAGMVRMGLAHLQAAQGAQQLSRWHLQAGIAAEHATAADYAQTDWAAIVRYYEMLLVLDGSAAPRLGHAIALAEAGEPTQALQRLRDLQGRVPEALAAHRLAAEARAHERQGEVDLAVGLLQQAVAVAPHAAESRALAQRARALQGQA